MKLKKAKPYAVPGPVGGTLIRQVIAGLREAGVELPVSSDILLAVSAGPDSVALAHLILKYGRRIAPDSRRIVLLHINHGWRGKASDGDEAFVKALGRRFKAKVVSKRAKKSAAKGESKEDAARKLRKDFFAQESAKRGGAPILTAHHADDLAETLLWRLFTGASETHGAGILPRHGGEVRPLLRIRKATLKRYLKEEGEKWREDATNFEGILLRSRLRKEVMPSVERLFPRSIEHLTKLAFGAKTKPQSEASNVLAEAFRALGVKARRPHLEAIVDNPGGELHLPQGWRLRQESRTRWVIEREERKGLKRTSEENRAHKHSE